MKMQRSIVVAIVLLLCITQGIWSMYTQHVSRFNNPTNKDLFAFIKRNDSTPEDMTLFAQKLNIAGKEMNPENFSDVLTCLIKKTKHYIQNMTENLIENSEHGTSRTSCTPYQWALATAALGRLSWEHLYMPYDSSLRCPCSISPSKGFYLLPLLPVVYLKSFRYDDCFILSLCASIAGTLYSAKKTYDAYYQTMLFTPEQLSNKKALLALLLKKKSEMEVKRELFSLCPMLEMAHANNPPCPTITQNS